MTAPPRRLATAGFAALLMLASADGAGAQARNAAELHAALHLTEAQEASWRAYQAALQPDAGAQARRQATQSMMAGLTTPRRIDLLDADMDQEVQVRRRQGEATKAFYGDLTPAQQKVFDRETLPPNDGPG